MIEIQNPIKGLSIVINCLGMPFNGDTLKNESLGGSETAALCLSRQLAKQGNEVKVFTTHEEGTVENFDNGGKLVFIPAGQQTEVTPLGDSFEFYAKNTPHDILIVQRYKKAFTERYAAKMQLLWLHDLALYRDKKDFLTSTFFTDGILVVSEYHKQQVCRVYGIPESLVYVVPNGVDVDLVKEVSGTMQAPEDLPGKKGKRLIYLSRPERGLDHLLKKGGIMEKLPDYDLFICTYNNVAPQMKDYYSQLWRKAHEMDNVHNLGFLSKKELYNYMLEMDLMVYPTPSDISPDFREVSCIAVMEAMHAGLPVITCEVGALPETLSGAGVIFSDVDRIAETILQVWNPELAAELEDMQLEAAKTRTWEHSLQALNRAIWNVYHSGSKCDTESRFLKHQIRHSGISTIHSEYGILDATMFDSIQNLGAGKYFNELEECYGFYPLDSYSDHYQNYYQYEADRGVDYGPEDLSGNSRFQTVKQIVADTVSRVDHPAVLDYGCAHGHYTINLAREFPNVQFVGVDITKSNVEKARKWAEMEELENVHFFCGEVNIDHELEINDESKGYLPEFDLAICAEVIEHVRDPDRIVNTIAGMTERMVVTTPYGPWEAMGYKQHWPWRAHVHNFTFKAIKRMYSEFKGLNIQCVPNGHTPFGEPIGSYVYDFYTKGGKAKSVKDGVFLLDNSEMIIESHGHTQTLSLCMIVKDDWQNLSRCLDSVKDIVDEIVVNFDMSGHNETAKSLVAGFAEENHIKCIITDSPSPLDIGFDEARNDVIGKATSDWILWLDSDEQMVHPQNLVKYLRHNCYDAYSIEQNHFSLDPAQVIKTDYPSKLFRNGCGIRFHGVVHEHPEKELNEGIGPVAVLPDVAIAHYGYENEIIRRDRFRRNFDLLRRDRQKNPDRLIGKFFWLRDMAQYCQFRMEEGAPVEALAPAFEEGFEIWPEIIKAGNIKMMVESAKFYTTLVKLSGKPGVLISDSAIITSRTGDSTVEFECLFRNKEEAIEFVDTLTRARLKDIPMTES